MNNKNNTKNFILSLSWKHLAPFERWEVCEFWYIPYMHTLKLIGSDLFILKYLLVERSWRTRSECCPFLSAILIYLLFWPSNLGARIYRSPIARKKITRSNNLNPQYVFLATFTSIYLNIHAIYMKCTIYLNSINNCLNI